MNLLNKYFDKEFPEGFLSLYGSSVILMISSGFLGIFLPIFLFNLFGSNIKLVALYYMIASLGYLLVLPLGAIFLNRFGFRNALRLSVLWGALYYVFFYFLTDENVYYLIPMSLVTLVLFRTFYWTPYHVDFAKFTDDSARGRQLSMFNITRDVMTGLVPILSGYIISQFGYSFVFGIAIGLFLASGLFFIDFPRTKEKFSWSYKESWINLFRKENRKFSLAFVSNGAEGVVGTIVWPIFIFQLLDGNYFQVGYLSAFIIILTIILRLFLGKKLDKGEEKKSFLKFGTVFYSIGWFIKIFIVTAFHVFAVGIYHNLMRVFYGTSFEVIAYDITIGDGHYVDELTVLREMSVHIGKIITLIAVILLSFFVPLQWTFVLAAVASLYTNYLREGVSW